jgi:glutamine amidotransferase
MPNVAILDYGVGNLLSVERAFDRLGIPFFRTNAEKMILEATHLVLPGVGAFSPAISVLKQSGLDKVVKRFAESGKPLLGICLGMQLLFEKSYEFGQHNGLGLIPGEVKPIAEVLQERAKVPSIGWKNLKLNLEAKSSLKFMPNDYFYFVHSFMGLPESICNLIATYRYAGLDIPAIVRRESVIGVQFHPEKSGNSGLDFIREFSKL